MVSTIRKAKEGVKRHGRGYNSKMYRLLTHTERKSGLGSISLAIGCNAASIAKQTKADIEKSL